MLPFFKSAARGRMHPTTVFALALSLIVTFGLGMLMSQYLIGGGMRGLKAAQSIVPYLNNGAGILDEESIELSIQCDANWEQCSNVCDTSFSDAGKEDLWIGCQDRCDQQHNGCLARVGAL